MTRTCLIIAGALATSCAARAPIQASADTCHGLDEAELATCIARRDSGLRFPARRTSAYLGRPGSGYPEGTWEVAWDLDGGRCRERVTEFRVLRAHIDLENRRLLQVEEETMWCHTFR